MTFSGGIIRPASIGEPLRVLLGGADCDNAMSVVEMTLAPGSTGPPLHLHPTHAEGFYVLAGQLSVQLGDEVISGGPGTWACAPKNTAPDQASRTTAVQLKPSENPWPQGLLTLRGQA